MTERGARVVLKELTKSYGVHVALAPTELTIEPGEFFSLIGPSGSGKSTLLGIIAGFLAPTAGHVEIDGVDVVSVAPYRRNIGMVFQSYALFPHMTVFENIAFPLRLRKFKNAEITSRVEQMLEKVRLRELGRRTPAQLSGGQQQRVALARAAIYDPRLLLMDEPLGALDKNLREEMQYEIRQFHAGLGLTILYVTHDQDEAATMSDRIGIMREGELVQTGRPRELYERPRNAFVAGFLGEANLFDVADVKSNGNGMLHVTTTEGVELPARAAAQLPSGALAVCIRPEAVSLRLAGDAARGEADAHVPGRIEDVVYTAGTVRYRVGGRGGSRFTVKLPAQREGAMLAAGTDVTIACSTADIQIIPKE